MSSAGNSGGAREWPRPERAEPPGSRPPAPARQRPARSVAPHGGQRPRGRAAPPGSPLRSRLVTGVIGNAAGNDQFKVSQVGGDIESEAMRSDAARNMNADGGDLALRTACSGLSVLSPMAAVLQDPHQTPVRPQIRPARTPKPPQRRISASSIPRTKSTGPMRPPFAAAQGAQIEDRVAHQLTRPVIGHVAAAVDLVDGDAARGRAARRRRGYSRGARCGPASAPADARAAAARSATRPSASRAAISACKRRPSS